MNKKTLESRAPSEAVITNVVTPHDTNHLGTLFGGTLMAWIDTAAGICAMRYAAMRASGKYKGVARGQEASVTNSRVSAVVTAAVDALQFAQPVNLGCIVTARAKINYVGNTSCEVGVRVTAEDMQSGTSVHAASAYLTMVALNKEGRPCPLPPLLVQSDSEKRRRRAAETRRAMRLALQRRSAAEDKT